MKWFVIILIVIACSNSFHESNEDIKLLARRVDRLEMINAERGVAPLMCPKETP